MADRIYSTSRWRKLRAAKLAEQPLCEVHLRRGKFVPANTVDHVVAVSAGGDPFPPLEGLMAMCASCHNVKTAARDNPAFGAGKGFRAAYKGCGLDGRPIDSDHPFLDQPGGYGGKNAGSSPPETVCPREKFT